MPRQIEVSDAQVSDVEIRIQMAEATGPILDNFDEVNEPLGNSVGHPGADEGQPAPWAQKERLFGKSSLPGIASD